MKNRIRIAEGSNGRQGGAVLYIALLVVVTLAAIGTIGVRSVQFEIATSGSVRQATQTRYVADAAAMITIWKFGSSGQFSAFERVMRTRAARDIPPKCLSEEDCWVFDTTSFLGQSPPIFVADPFGGGALTPRFEVITDNKIPILAMPGFSLPKSTSGGNDYEFQKWTFTSQGVAQYGVALNRADSSETIRVTTVIGPVVREH